MMQRKSHFVHRAALALCFTVSAAVVPAISASASPIDGTSCNQWVRLVDISSYQSNISWTNVARAGISGVYVKATEGTWYVSPTFASQTIGARSVGLPWGGYDYARAGETDPVADAQYFVAAGGASGTLPPVLDLEQSTLSGSWTVLWASRWAAEVGNLTGRSVTVYTGAYYPWSNDPSLPSVGPLWISAYPFGYSPVPNGSACGLQQPTTGAWGAWSMWQYTSVGSVWGIDGNVDVNAATPAWWTQATGGGVAPPSPGTNNYPGATYAIGSSGDAVVKIQTTLRAAGLFGGTVDGIYGQDTANAVYSWQVRLGISPADGVWGPATQKATSDLFTWLNSLPKPVPRPKPVIKYGETGKNVKHLQRALGVVGVRVHKHRIPKNSKYDVTTAEAVAKFKTTCHLKIDGRRWGHLVNKCLRAQLKAKGR